MSFSRATIIICFIALLGVPLVFRPSAETDAVAGEAKPLIIITPHNEQIRFEFKLAFERWHEDTYGQPVEVIYNVPGGTSEIRKMLESQYLSALEAGREPGGDADLVFGGGSFEHGRLKRGVTIDGRHEPISQPIDFTQARLYEIYGENDIGGERLYDPDRYWFGVALSGFGIVYNHDVLTRLGVASPTMWKDLCNPKLQGWIASVNPNQSGSVTTAFESILKREGWERGWRILRRQAANARYFSASSLKPPMDVSVGDAAMGICIDFYGRFQSQALREAGDPDRIGYVDPVGGSTIDADPISLLRGAPHPELAVRFIEFCLSDQGQALWQFHGSKHAKLGPQRFELRRLPVRRDMYVKYADQMIDDVNPFAIATAATYPNPDFRDFIAPMYAAMAIDNHHALRDAWKAIVDHPAYPSDAADLITAESVADPTLKAMLESFDRLPVVAGPEGSEYDLNKEADLAAVRAGWLRSGWKKHDLWHEESSAGDALRARMGEFFRDMYKNIERLAENGLS